MFFGSTVSKRVKESTFIISGVWFGVWFIVLLQTICMSNSATLFKIIELFYALFMILFFRTQKDNGIKQLLGLVRIVNILVLTFGTYELISRNNPLIELFKRDYISDLFGLMQYRVCNVFTHPIVYSHVLLICFVITYFYEDRRAFKVICLTAISIQIMFTQTRSAWFAFVIIIICIVIVESKGKITKEMLINSTIAIIAIVTVIVIINNKFHLLQMIVDRFLYLQTDNVSFIQRIGSIQYICEKYLNSGIVSILFGSGSRASAEVMEQTMISIKGFKTTDNQYLSLLINYGIIGIVIVIYMVNKIIAYWKSNTGISICLIGTIIMLFFYEGLYWPLIFCMVVYLLCTPFSKEESKGDDS